MKRLSSIVLAVLVLSLRFPVPDSPAAGERRNPGESASLYGFYTDADVPALGAKYPNLKELRIGWPGMTDSATAEIAKLTALEKLDIGNIGSGNQGVVLTGAGWQTVRTLPKLRELTVNDVKIDDAGMKEIGKFSQIKTLYLAHNGVTDAGIKHLAGMTQLTELGLLQEKLTDESLPVLMKLQKVEILKVDQTRLTDAAVKAFAKLPNLKWIDVRSTKITPAGVKELLVCTSLRRLYVLNKQVPADVLAALREGNRDLAIVITDVGSYLEPLGRK